MFQVERWMFRPCPKNLRENDRLSPICTQRAASLLEISAPGALRTDAPYQRAANRIRFVARPTVSFVSQVTGHPKSNFNSSSNSTGFVTVCATSSRTRLSRRRHPLTRRAHHAPVCAGEPVLCAEITVRLLGVGFGHCAKYNPVRGQLHPLRRRLRSRPWWD
jgi:hypothetical protein